ncbi:SH3 domain-containing C40 family peptidase [Anaerococcus sp.]|uniref:C40 family peptidase n=1 Tax=Anaerococcus sp. TaxID=1872515 RepID=UPI0027B94E30|nr:SH3 domain-containing C40 family peptidase [Anaerococcus sp.]
MNKKNIGAMLSVIAAVTAGASAYATTINNLDQDQHTNSLITEANYTESYSDYDLVKSEYTEDVKNTKIAKEAKPAKEEKTEVKSDLDKLVENAARDAVVEITAAKEVEASEEVPEKKDEKVEAKEETEEKVEKEEVSKEEASEEKTEESDKEEEKESTVVKYVNTEVLNVRSTKNMDENNIVSSLKAGDEIAGVLEDGFLNTELGYVNEEFLSDVYPVELVSELNENEEAKKAQEAEEAKKAEEARLAQEAKEAEEAKNAQEAKEAEETRKAEEARQAEEARKAEDAKKAQEAKEAEEARKAQEAEEARKAEEARQAEEERQSQAAQSYYYTGWVNTSVLNVRSSAGDGSIIGSVRKGDWLEGKALNGWLEIDYNGQKGYVSIDFISDTEVAKEEVKEEVVEAQEQVQEAQEVEQASAPAYSGSGLSAADLATQFVGSPYVWGSANPGVGFDCSGLTSYVYSQMGISIPHQSAAQYSSGYAVDSSNLQAGDLVFFSYGGGGIDHVGIVVNSDGTFVHASTPATGVRYDNVYNGSFQNAFVGARRIY